MQTIENGRLITCIIPKGEGINLIKMLKEEKNIRTANVAGGRGGGRRGRIEVDIVTVVVEQDSAEGVFNFIYDKAHIGDYHSGIMYQGKLARSTVFVLPQTPSESE